VFVPPLGLFGFGPEFRNRDRLFRHGSFPFEVQFLLMFGHFVCRNHSNFSAPLCVQDREQTPLLWSGQTKPALFGFVRKYTCN
jgi:hypothetical protein